VIEVVD